MNAWVCPSRVARVAAALRFASLLSDPPVHVPSLSSTSGASRTEVLNAITEDALPCSASRRLGVSCPMCWWATASANPNLRPSASISLSSDSWNRCASSTTTWKGLSSAHRPGIASAIFVNHIIPSICAWSRPIRGADRSMRTMPLAAMTPLRSRASAPVPKAARITGERTSRSNLEAVHAITSPYSLERLAISSVRIPRASPGSMSLRLSETRLSRPSSVSSAGMSVMGRSDPNKWCSTDASWRKIRSKRGPTIPVLFGSRTR